MANTDDKKGPTQADAAALQSKYGVDFNSLGDKAPAPGDDSIQPVSSPIDLAAGAAASKLAGPAEAGLRALAADEAGVFKVGGPAEAAPGLIQKAEAAVGAAGGDKLEAAKALVENTYAAVSRGEIPMSQFQAAVSKYNSLLARQPQKFADGGGVLAMPDAPQESTDASFAKAFAPENAMGVDTGQPRYPAAQPAPVDSGPINVINPEGKLVALPSEQVHEALSAGYQLPTPQHIEAAAKEQKYGGALEQVKTGLEGAAEAGTFGLSTGIEKALGAKDEDIQGRRETNPGVHALGQMAGLGASLLTGVGEGAALTKLGEAGATAVGLSAPVGTLAKIGSAAVKAAIENAAFSGGDVVSKMISSDPALSVESAAAEVGLAGLIGAGFGGAIGSVSPLWQATLGKKADGLLGAITQRLGGAEGSQAVPGMSTEIQDALQSTGLAEKFAPEVQAALSDDPTLRGFASTLAQRDTGSVGPAFQRSLQDARMETAAYQAETMGTKLADIPAKGEIDKYTTGRSIGETLAKEFDTRIAPLAKEYEGYAEKFAGKDLIPSVAQKADDVAAASDKAFGAVQKAETVLKKALRSQDPGAAIEAEARLTDAQQNLRLVRQSAQAPGTIDKIQESLANLVTREGWHTSPSSDIMREVGRVQKEIGNVKTLEELTQYIKAVGENTKSTLPFGQQTPVSRAGGLIKSILRDAEGEAITSHLNPEELVRYRETQAAFAQAAKLKEAIDDRLGAGGSVSGYAKTVKAMSSQEGEKVLQRLMGAKDADWLSLVQEQFPETAATLKQHYVDQLLAAAKDGDGISSKKLMNALDKMSPQARDFALTQEQQAKLAASHSLIEQLNDKNYNFSNTARTLDKLTHSSGGAALGLVSLLTGHGAAESFLVGAASNILGKTVPDHARLALLKFLGSTNKVDGGALKAAADYIGRVAKGESLVTKATKNVFKDGADVLPDSKRPTEALRARLDKKLQELAKNPDGLLEAGGKTGHYMPEQSAAIGETNARVVNYVNSQRPHGQKLGPLDPVLPPSDIEKAAFDKVLDIAQQPLTVVERIKDGSLTPDDVVHLQAMYPKMYDNLVQKLTDAMTEHVSAEGEVPYHTRIALSIFMGQPLDATMTPEAIMAAQPKPATAQPGQATEPKHSTAKLGKLPNSYMTATQSAEKNNQPKK